MKRITSINIIYILLSHVIFAQNMPTEGDIIFTQIGSNPNIIEFITLVPDLDLTHLKITDNGVTSSGHINNNDDDESGTIEGTFDLFDVKDEAWHSVPGGTFIRLGSEAVDDNNPFDDRIMSTTIPETEAGTFILDPSGDQLIAYTNTPQEPFFIAGTNYSRSSKKWIKRREIDETTSYSPGTSSDITLTKNSNFYFSGYVDGDKKRTQQALSIPSNWTASSTSVGWRDLTSNIGNSAVPVELTSFTASTYKNGIMLNWQTATEVNNYGFEIERQNSELASQKSEWRKLGFAEGHGNSYSPKQYSFYDNSPVKGKAVYRLKQIDTDGAFEYSNEVEISFLQSDKTELYQNHPNPFNPSTVISFSLPELAQVSIIIYNAIGQQVLTLLNKQISAGIHNVNFDGSNLSTGFYFYRLETPNYSKTMKMMLIK